MRACGFIVVFATAAGGNLAGSGAAAAQTLSDALVAEVRAGARKLSLDQDSTVVPLLGTPTLPLVEVYLNRRGPFQFLVDLGSNVVVVRRRVADSSRAQVVVERKGTDIIRIPDLQLGAARFEGMTVGAYDTLDVDGVLGYNVLRYAGFTLDYPRRRFVLHRRRLPPPNGVSVLSYEVHDRMPFVRVQLGSSSFLVNLDTGASEWMTVPPALRDSIRWMAAPEPGPMVSNNQTGDTRVLLGRSAGLLTFGALQVASPCIYVNPDADAAWLGSGAMRWAAWTFDPMRQRVEVSVPPRGSVGDSPCGAD